MSHPNEETSIVLSGDWTSPEAERLSAAWFSAMAMEHKLPPEVRYMDGMSGKKYRYLINNLVASTSDARYLEIGCWAGSTACSAMWGNKLKATCIDNWSELGGPRDRFVTNTNAVRTPDIDFTLIEQDFNTVDVSKLGKFNIYMFDGPHDERDQYNGIALYQQALDDTYILIVDDWNGDQVRNGTLQALIDLNNTVLASIEIVTRRNDTVHPEVYGQYSDWHNGYFIAVIQK